MKSVLAHFAKRFIAGETREEAVEEARRLNGLGLKATMDFLGENVRNPDGADAAVAEYISLLDDIQSTGVDSTVSLKLTHMGLDLSVETAMKNLEKIVSHAADLNNFVRIDMESSAYTERTLDIFHAVRKEYTNVGVALQCYLRRSDEDAEKLIEAEASVRLVKGAYSEPDDIAFPDKKDVDENFSGLMRSLMLKGRRLAVATHDDKLIDEAKGLAKERGLTSEDFEFQMLLGIREKLQVELAEEGHKVRVYLPYGPEWLPYILRRLTERKENLYFVLKNYFK